MTKSKVIRQEQMAEILYRMRNVIVVWIFGAKWKVKVLAPECLLKQK